MSRLLTVLVILCGVAAAQTSACSCGATPIGRPAPRSMKPYAQEPDDLRPFSKFAEPYFQHYTDLVEYNGAARDVPDPTDVSEVRIGFLGPLYDHPDHIRGAHMLNGAQLAIDEANAAGGYCGKPFRLMLHNDAATWGASSNEIVKMIYDENVWAMFGSISGDSTHIALRVSLKGELPIVNSASTDPTIPETIIPWFLTDLQDDRVQGYTLARHIYTELGLKRVAILRENDRYGRFGVLKFRDASRRLGHPVVIEQKFLPSDTDFSHQLRVIQDSRADAIVLWTDVAQAGAILKQMRELGMTQRAFGSHRTIGEELLQLAGPAAEGYEAVFPYDPSSSAPQWLAFQHRFTARYDESPDHFAALAYDAMQILLKAICRAGLNKGRIRDALTSLETYSGATGDMIFDPNCKNIHPLYLAAVHNGQISYRLATMNKELASAPEPDNDRAPITPALFKKESDSYPAALSEAPTRLSIPYAMVGEDGVAYLGPSLENLQGQSLKVAVFGRDADQIVQDLIKTAASQNTGRPFALIPVASESSWGKASTALVNAVYADKVLAIVALDRAASHLAEQIAVKSFVPVIAISDDTALTSTNIPWIFRLPAATSSAQALEVLYEAIRIAGPNRADLRAVLASGKTLTSFRFSSNGEPQ